MLVVSAWTETNVERLKTWWAEGRSCSIIANEFNKLGFPITKNAVIGKIHRLNLPRPEGMKYRSTPARPRVVRHSAPVQIGSQFRKKMSHSIRTGEPIVIKEPDPEKQVLLREAPDGKCRAIIGYRNGVLADAVCCGEDTHWIVNSRGRLVLSPWCDHHRAKYIMEPKHERDRGNSSTL